MAQVINIIKQIRSQIKGIIHDVKPAGPVTQAFKYWSYKKEFEEHANKTRLFTIQLDPATEPETINTAGLINFADYNLYINIKIVYNNSVNDVDLVSMNDYNLIKSTLRTSGITANGFNFLVVQTPFWETAGTDDEKTILTIPVMLRITADC